MNASSLTERLGEDGVGAELIRPHDAVALFVFAHGAGAGIEHPFMAAMATQLAEFRIATLRFQFPYMDARRRRPDPPSVLIRTIRTAVARGLLEELPIFAGGKSMGGRMTSLAESMEHLPQVRGLVLLGFPLHPAKQASTTRGEHLSSVSLPMLFVQGTRDALADLGLLRPIIARLPRARLIEIADADHGFGVPKRSGRTDEVVLAEIAAEVAGWMIAFASHQR